MLVASNDALGVEYLAAAADALVRVTVPGNVAYLLHM